MSNVGFIGGGRNVDDCGESARLLVIWRNRRDGCTPKRHTPGWGGRWIPRPEQCQTFGGVTAVWSDCLARRTGRAPSAAWFCNNCCQKCLVSNIESMANENLLMALFMGKRVERCPPVDTWHLSIFVRNLVKTLGSWISSFQKCASMSGTMLQSVYY